MNEELQLGLFSRKRIPLIRQAERSECGLTCLAMILGYHGNKIDMASLRTKVGPTPRGASAAKLIQIADELKFNARAFRIELDDLTQVQCPAILHWDLKHFVVLSKATKKGITIVDPARGRRWLTNAEASDHFTGVVLELTPGAGFERRDERRTVHLRSLWSGTKGLYGSLGHLLLLSLLVQGLLVITPLFAKIAIDEIIPVARLESLQVLFLGFLILSIFHILFNFVRDYLVIYVSNTINFQLASNIVKHLISLPPFFFQQRHLGDIMSRLVSGRYIEIFLTNGAVSIIVDSVLGLLSLIILFLISPTFGFIVLGVTSAHLLIVFLTSPSVRRVNEEMTATSATEYSYLMETARAITTIKSADGGADRAATWRNIYIDVVNLNAKERHIQNWLKLSERIFYNLDVLLIIYFGVAAVINNKLTIGTLLAVLSYRSLFSNRAIALFNQLIQLSILRVHLNRLAEIVFAEPEIDDQTLSEPIIINRGDVEVRRLLFRYSKRDNAIIENVNFRIDSGDFVVLTGPSGTGKTTLLKILAGLLQAEDGDLLVDGTPVIPTRLSSYRRQIGIVLQDDKLLRGSIGENIAMFPQQMDFDRVVECAQIACIAEDIEHMPMRYNTSVGDLGSTLSGGQLQRLFLARALYRSPRILFLDEATSNLDVVLERRIINNLRQLPLTCIQAAHRPQTIDAADYIIHIDISGQVSVGDKAVSSLVSGGANNE